MQDTAEREDGLHVHKVSVVQGGFVHNKFLQEKQRAVSIIVEWQRRMEKS